MQQKHRGRGSNDNQSDDEPKAVFQAIGTLYSPIISEQIPIPHSDETKEGFFIKIKQDKYRIYILSNRYRSWLLQQKNHPDLPLYLRVYPKYQIVPRKPPEIYFQVVAWSEDNQWDEGPGQFLGIRNLLKLMLRN